MTEKKEVFRGLPLKEREQGHIKAALQGHDPAVVKEFTNLWHYARNHQLGLTRLGHVCGIAPGVLSPCFNGDYKGDYAAIAERIIAFFWRLKQKEQYGGIREFRPTKLSKTLAAIFDKTRIVRRIQVLESPEQLGKTRTAMEYAKKHNGGRTVYVQLTGGANQGCGDFIWTLADKAEIPYSIRLREKRLRIRQALESCDLVIVDEAHLVFTWSLRGQRDFWDYLRTDIFDNGARGVVLIATNAHMMDGLRAFRKQANYNVGQLLGRMRNEVMRIDPFEDVILADVAMLVERYYKPGAVMLKKLHKIAQRPGLGHYGLLEDIMNEAWTKAKARKKTLSDDIVKSTADQILASLDSRKP